MMMMFMLRLGEHCMVWYCIALNCIGIQVDYISTVRTNWFGFWCIR